MGNSISFDMNGRDPEYILGKVRALVKKHAGKLEGDASVGTFEVKGVHGNYSIQAPALTVDITKRPGYLPMFVITRVIKRHGGEICGQA